MARIYQPKKLDSAPPRPPENTSPEHIEHIVTSTYRTGTVLPPRTVT